MPFRASSLHTRRTLCAVLWFALALAQTLGLVHRIVHSPLALHASAPSRAEPGASQTDWLKALFAGHGGNERGCTLYDQSSHTDVMPVGVTDVPLVHARAVCPTAQPT